MTSASPVNAHMLQQAAFTQLSQVDELAILNIRHPLFEAEIALQGAQLLRFRPTGQPDWIWLSPEAEYKQGQSLRGGVPICWPWFGVAAKNPDLLCQQIKPNAEQAGSHGFARALNWDLVSLNERAHGVELALQLNSNADTLDIWPFPFKLTAIFHLGRTLDIRLVTDNLSDQTMMISQALHTYFPCEDIQRVRIQGTGNQALTDALDNWSETVQQGTQHFNEEVDRIYHTGGPFRLETGSTPLSLTSHNSQTSVIWNPWIEKSKRLSQFADYRYKEMFCVETANVLSDCKEIEPNSQISIGFTLAQA